MGRWLGGRRGGAAAAAAAGKRAVQLGWLGAEQGEALAGLHIAWSGELVQSPGSQASHALCCTATRNPHRREQLIGLTDVTRSHFDKLVNEFEKGLDEALKEYDGERLLAVAE